MKINFFPLLQIQRDLYGIPLGRERFQAYLGTLIDPLTKDLRLPLPSMNPMGKDHVPVLLDELLKINADGLAAQAIANAAPHLKSVPGESKVVLVLADDAKGSWTNRYASEFSHRFESGPLLKRGWLVGTLWTSEPVAGRLAQEAALTAVFRAAHIHRHGHPETLREMLAQEGYAMAMAGCETPALETDDVVYTREVISPCLEAKDRPTVMACLFGDKAASALGYAAMGLSPFAGLALALHEARVSSPLVVK